MSKTKGRVEIPADPKELLDLSNKVYLKDTADGDKSVLKAMEGYNWPIVGPTIETALQKHSEAEDYKRKMEEAYRDRDNLLPAIEDMLRKSKNLLKAMYPNNPKRLGEYGLDVDDSPKAPKKPGK